MVGGGGQKVEHIRIETRVFSHFHSVIHLVPLYFMTNIRILFRKEEVSFFLVPSLSAISLSSCLWIFWYLVKSSISLYHKLFAPEIRCGLSFTSGVAQPFRRRLPDASPEPNQGPREQSLKKNHSGVTESHRDVLRLQQPLWQPAEWVSRTCLVPNVLRLTFPLNEEVRRPSKAKCIHPTAKERCFFGVKSVSPPTWLLSSYWSFQSRFRHPSSENPPILPSCLCSPVSLGIHTLRCPPSVLIAGIIKN